MNAETQVVTANVDFGAFLKLVVLNNVFFTGVFWHMTPLAFVVFDEGGIALVPARG